MGRKLYTPLFGHIHLRGSSRVPSDLGRQPQKSERNSGVAAAPNGRNTGMGDAPSRRVPHSPKCTVPTVSNCNPFDHEHRLTFPFCRGATQCHLDDFARQTARPGAAATTRLTSWAGKREVYDYATVRRSGEGAYARARA